MKKIKVTRDILRGIAKRLNDGTKFVCICDTQRHISLYVGVIVLWTYENSEEPVVTDIKPFGVELNIGDGCSTFMTKQSYDPANFEGQEVRVLRLQQ